MGAKAWLVGGALGVALFAGAAHGQAPGGPDERAAIEAAISAQDFQGAMALAHGIEPDGPRFALEAEILYRAHSYAAALGRAQEARALGEDGPLLAFWGLQAALWVRDRQATGDFRAALEGAVGELPADERAAWQPTLDNLGGYADELEAELAAVDAAISRARTTTLGLLVALALGLGLIARR